MNEYTDTTKKGCLWSAVGIAILTGIAATVYFIGWFGEAAQVAKEEVGPRALLKKYEWFKDAKSTLDSKLATLKVYEQRFADLSAQYEGVARNQWNRADIEQSNLWRSEAAGISAIFNTIAAQYNSNMAKINWRFTNVGDLPEGETEPLPREYTPYQVQ